MRAERVRCSDGSSKKVDARNAEVRSALLRPISLSCVSFRSCSALISMRLRNPRKREVNGARPAARRWENVGVSLPQSSSIVLSVIRMGLSFLSIFFYARNNPPLPRGRTGRRKAELGSDRQGVCPSLCLICIPKMPKSY
ncbi:hypothetical protein CUJ84_Chr000508 [Rhizobium leguminosarum]|uniref:Uncharacterized protein n=1 Tax=Rhizobium leguminosarum TaxID=384 RepID=A0A2K9YY57_RHILE|nr:hypothetical protein CUJ84_Chr000508 [Rhizobium leguminosarum]